MKKWEYVRYYSILLWKNLVPGWFIIFLISFLFGLTYELLLVEIEAPYHWFVGAGRFFIQLAYGYMAGYIFYFLTVHIPSVDKRIHMFRFINNSVAQLNRVIDSIYEKCPKSENSFLTATEIKLWLKSINPLQAFTEGIRGMGYVEHPNFYSFLFSKRVHINSQIQIMMNHQDVLSFDVIRNLSHISDALNKLDIFAMSLPANKDAEILGIALNSIPLYMYEIFNDLSLGNREYLKISSLLNKKELDHLKSSIRASTPSPSQTE